MKIKVADATPQQLNWMVAKAEGVNAEAFDLYYEPTESSDLDTHGYPEFHYSTVWAQGGPIVEREGIATAPADRFKTRGLWIARRGRLRQIGPTPLIAGLRCYVASRLGDEADVPEGLV